MNLKEITQIDIQSINISHIILTLLKRKDLLGNVIIVIIALFVTSQIVVGRNKKLAEVKSEIFSLEGKMTAVSSLEQADKDFKDFVATLPQGPKDINSIVSKLNEFATKNEIQISTFSPSGQTTNEFYDLVKIRISIVAKSFENIGYFIYDIENSNNNLRVENLTMGGQTQYTRRRWARPGSQDDKKDDSLTAEVDIGSINPIR